MSRVIWGIVIVSLILLATHTVQAGDLPDWVDLSMLEKASAEFPDDDMVQLMYSSDVDVKESGWCEITERELY